MDHHIKEYFCQFSDDLAKGNFHKVIALHEETQLNWETVSKMVPKLCKGWFELIHLKPKDRVEFVRDYWLSQLPFHPHLAEFIMRFFQSLDDVAIFLSQKNSDSPFEATLVYSLSGDNGFFRGQVGATDEDLVVLKNSFSNFILPEDYLSFLKIHNGFGKTTDSTGIISSENMLQSYLAFHQMLETREPVMTTDNQQVNPKTLIPFYGSFGMPFYQCFWEEWYPENEMGNVYYSGTTNMISDVKKIDPSAESMAFPTFLDWLMFYMERFA